MKDKNCLLYSGLHLWEILDCSKDEYDFTISNEKERAISKLKDLFGPDLTGVYKPYSISERSVDWFQNYAIDRTEKIEQNRIANNVEFLYQGQTLSQIFACSTSTIDYLNKNIFPVSKRNRTIINILPLIFGSDLSLPGDFNNLGCKQRTLFKKFKAMYIPVIKKMENNANAKTLYEYLDCTPEEFSVISRSNHKDSKVETLLKREFGVDYSKKSNMQYLSNEEKSAWRSFLKYNCQKIQLIRNHNSESDNKKASKFQIEFVETLEDIIGCSKEELEYVITRFNKKKKTYKTIIRLFGENLDQKCDTRFLTEDEKNTIYMFKHDAIKRIKEYHYRLDKVASYKGMDLQQIIGCSKEELASLKTRYYKSTNIEILVKAFGGDLTKPFNSDIFTNEELLTLFRYINFIFGGDKEAKIASRTYIEINPNYLYEHIHELFGCTKEEFRFVCIKLQKGINSRRFAILTKVFNKEPLTLDEYHLLKSYTSIVKSRLPKYKKEYYDRLSEDQSYKVKICELLKLSLNKVDLILLHVNYYSEDYNLIKRYGYQEKLTSAEKKRIIHILDNAQKIALSNKKAFNNKTLREILECTEEEFNYLLSSLKNDTVKYQILVSIFGENFDKKLIFKSLNSSQRQYFNIYYYDFVDKLKKYRQAKLEVRKPVEILLPADTITVKSPLYTKEFIKLVGYIPETFRRWTILRLGLYDGNVYSNATIAYMYDVNEDVVKGITEKGLGYFRIILTYYLNKHNELNDNTDVQQVLSLLR